MQLTFRDLETILAAEFKKCDDHLVIGGLEKYIENWARSQATEGDAALALRVHEIVNSLRGYGDVDVLARKQMLKQAIALVRDIAAPGARQATNQPPASMEKMRSKEQNCASDQPLDAQFQIDRQDAPPPKPVSRGGEIPGLEAGITRLQSVGPGYAKRLAKLGVFTVQDLIYLFPRRYDDYSQLKTISQLMYGEQVTLLLTVCEANTRRTQRGIVVTNVLLSDSTGTIHAVYFNQPYLQQQFKPGMQIVVSGRVDKDLTRLSLKAPEWEPFSAELLHTARVVPVYPLTEGLTNRRLRRLIHSVIEYWAPRLPDPLPASVRQQLQLLDLSTALHQAHFPSNLEQMQEARRRLAFEEFLYIQLGVLRQRRKWREQPGRAFNVDPKFISEFKSRLPFKLTSAQERAIGDILADIQHTQPMSRLLQGDVGSGKTVVAAAAIAVAAENGAQVAVLAPTEILAEQHFKTLSALLGDKLRVSLLTGSLKSKEKDQVRSLLAQGDVQVAIGTHALIQQSVRFRELGLAIIDEQHRFGVEQRGTIRAKGYNPHILVMSATPIPRTLALTVYGDLDLSIINEMPPGRQEIKTKWLEPRERERAYSFIRTHVSEGRQAFVICPLIEESEAVDAKAAVEEYERLRTLVFPDLHVGLIHGKLKASEKDDVMNAFRERSIDILVATSVVEVGIDIPNATVMLIEGADRFGLAQLHQFRGRVGRGEHQSFCMLLAEKSGATSDDRLKVIESSQDGFRLAEEDLKLRGPGEFFGTRQSGLPDLKVAKLSDVKYLEQARAVAQDIFSIDPELGLPQHQLIAEKVNQFWKGKGDLS